MVLHKHASSSTQVPVIKQLFVEFYFSLIVVKNKSFAMKEELKWKSMPNGGMSNSGFRLLSQLCVFVYHS